MQESIRFRNDCEKYFSKTCQQHPLHKRKNSLSLLVRNIKSSVTRCTNRAGMPRWSSYDVDKRSFINVKKTSIMNKQNHAYAQARIDFYGTCFQDKTIPQLVNDFNKLAGSRGWTAERSYYSVALTNEMLRRGMDLSAISETDNISGKIISVRLRNVRYDEALHKLMLIQ